MAITRDDVSKVAHLARMDLTEKELELFSRQLVSILDFIDKLKELEVSEVKPTSCVLNLENIVRADIQGESLPLAAVLKNAPLSLKNHFQVPKVIE